MDKRDNQAAVMLGSNGDVTAMLIPCPGDRVVQVSLHRLPAGANPATTELTLLWTANPNEFETLERFIIEGVASDGESSQDFYVLRFHLDGSPSPITASFIVDELDNREVRSAEEFMSFDSWQLRATAHC